MINIEILIIKFSNKLKLGDRMSEHEIDVCIEFIKASMSSLFDPDESKFTEAPISIRKKVLTELVSKFKEICKFINKITDQFETSVFLETNEISEILK